MRRRSFLIIATGTMAIGPRVSRAHAATKRVVGYLTASTLSGPYVSAFRQGMEELGFVEGKNVVFENRAAENQYGRLPMLAGELVKLNVAVIAAVAGVSAVRAAMTATQTIPIVFTSGSDPVALGIVSNLARPGGNVTGISSLTSESATKRLGLVKDLLPNAKRIAFLSNPTGPNTASEMKALTAAHGLDRPIQVLDAANEDEIDRAFAALDHEPVDALLIGLDPLFVVKRDRIAASAARQGIPAFYPDRAFVVAGGLLSYGTDLKDVYRQAGIYVGKILHGVKPGDLPVMQSRTFELVINLNTARALGIAIPPTLLARADEVIE